MFVRLSTRFIAAVQNDTYVALSKGQLIKTGDSRNPPMVPGGAHLLVRSTAPRIKPMSAEAQPARPVDYPHSTHPQPVATARGRGTSAFGRNQPDQGSGSTDVCQIRRRARLLRHVSESRSSAARSDPGRTRTQVEIGRAGGHVQEGGQERRLGVRRGRRR